MTSLLIPMSMLVKKYLPLPYGWGEISIYFFLIITLFYLIKGRGIYLKDIINVKLGLLITALCMLQAVAFLKSDIIGMLNVDPLKALAKLLMFVFLAFTYYVCLSIIVRSEYEVKSFLRGLFIAMVAVSLSAYLQLVLILTKNPVLVKINNAISNVFEQRVEREWYENGSYTTTLWRINSIFQESGFFVAMICIVFMPFILSAIKNRYNILSVSSKYRSVLYYGLLINFIIILLVARSTTGLIGIVLILFIILINFKMKSRVVIVSISLIIMSFMYYLYQQGGYITALLDETIFEKGKSSLDNRIGGTIALINTSIQNLFLGVGWENTTKYLFENVPVDYKFNYEYQNIFVPTNTYPVLSVFFGYFSFFGITLTSIFFYFIYKNYKVSKRLLQQLRDHNNYLLFKTIIDAEKYFLFIYLILSVFSFDWKQPYYLVIFAFYFVIRNILKRSVNLKS